MYWCCTHRLLQLQQCTGLNNACAAADMMQRTQPHCAVLTPDTHKNTTCMRACFAKLRCNAQQVTTHTLPSTTARQLFTAK